MAELTFIIPTINRPTLSRAVQSLTSQTNQNWYAIIIGDGVKPSLQPDRRIHTTFITPQGSPGLVRNAALPLVVTPYVAFLDDDDELMPGYVETFYSHFDDQPDIIIQKMSNLHPDGKRSEIPFSTDPQKLEYGHVGINFAVKTNILRRHPFIHHGTQNEDWEFIQWCRDNNCSIVIVPSLGYVVRPA